MQDPFLVPTIDESSPQRPKQMLLSWAPISVSLLTENVMMKMK